VIDLSSGGVNLSKSQTEVEPVSFTNIRKDTTLAKRGNRGRSRFVAEYNSAHSRQLSLPDSMSTSIQKESRLNCRH
jgi:hypothetical protein